MNHWKTHHELHSASSTVPEISNQILFLENDFDIFIVSLISSHPGVQKRREVYRSIFI